MEESELSKKRRMYEELEGRLKKLTEQEAKLKTQVESLDGQTQEI